MDKNNWFRSNPTNGFRSNLEILKLKRNEAVRDDPPYVYDIQPVMLDNLITYFEDAERLLQSCRLALEGDALGITEPSGYVHVGRSVAASLSNQIGMFLARAGTPVTKSDAVLAFEAGLPRDLLVPTKAFGNALEAVVGCVLRARMSAIEVSRLHQNVVELFLGSCREVPDQMVSNVVFNMNYVEATGSVTFTIELPTGTRVYGPYCNGVVDAESSVESAG